MTKQVDLIKYWEQFVFDGIINQNVNPRIAKSWQQSKALGLDPYICKQGKKIEETIFQELLENNRELLSIAKPVIENLYSFVKGSGFLLVLTDEHANIIELIGDEAIHKMAQEYNFLKGYKLSQEVVGTNSISVALDNDCPIQTMGAEHYAYAHRLATSSTAPIHNECGEIIGSLSMTGLVENVNKHTLGMVYAAVLNIEKQIEILSYNRLINVSLNTIPDGIMITDTDFKILIVNPTTQRIFRKTAGEIEGLDVRQLFQDVDFEKLLREKSYIEDTETTLYFNGNYKSVFLNVIAMIEGDLFLGLSVAIRESKQVKTLINKAVGNKAKYIFDDIITKNSSMMEMIEQAKRTSKANCSVLIIGESGTGKELFAQAIHNESNRSKGPFVAVNCAALPRDLIESELFGYETGAFTGAMKGGQAGKFELADGGTIFLDEIGELPIEVQSKLLRVLDSHQITRIGGKRSIDLDVKVIAATNRDLYQECQLKNFRSDLYYRLNVMSFSLIPLRERKEDILPLANRFLEKLNRENNDHYELPVDFLASLFSRDWRGNVREFQNVISRKFHLRDDELTMSDKDIAAKDKDEPDFETIVLGEDIEKIAIINALKIRGGNAILAADDLNIGKSTIYRKIKKYKIDVNEFKKL